MWEWVRRAVLHSLSTALLRLWKWVRAFWYKNGLLTLSMLSVVTGCLLGFLLRALELTDLEKQYFSFPGELLMRMLKMLILPLITSSLMSGLATMDSKACGKMGVITITYYLWTTFMAVTVGIILVVSIHPGAAAQKDNHSVGKVVLSSADALLDLIRNMFPSNLVEASFQQYRTVLVPVVKSPGFPKIPGKPVNFIYFAPDDKNPEIHRPVFLELTPSPEMTYRTLAGTSNEMNVLGIVIFSATIVYPLQEITPPALSSSEVYLFSVQGTVQILDLGLVGLCEKRPDACVCLEQRMALTGLLLGKMGERGAPLVNVCQCLNEAVMKIVSMAVWYFPFGIVFLIAGKILEMEDPSVIGQKLGLYVITVVSGLALHGIILLPLLFVLITKKNPFAFIQGILQALLIALATSSSSATLPITLKCLLENNGIDRRVARFVLPVGATINMDGTALYEAVAAIFIAQVNEYELDLGQIITISITASAASIGAAGIPQSGLVTMVIVLTSVGLPTEDITLIIAVDWALDRLRTMTNVLGDALAAGIIAHVCEKDFAPKPPLQNPVSNTDKFPSAETSHLHPKDNGIEMTEETMLDQTGVHYNICQV
ncbi:excitatory amino acid transporter 5-like isoform X2 [Motacilla alba alba]|uniref:excitatory amino acid transporter 5-like isoform X2 n=1 Tax=Motacilla alba alba TaxID=1094192 RepID=UPI0018D51EC1|nr:excitatory amino acid transporter 5-like isoform X2 [Motacilla alba alba]